MASELSSVLKILDLEPLETNLFRGVSPKVGWQRVFGGQVIGQALVAATRTVPEVRRAHSLHGYFIRPGDPETPIIYEVDRYRDGLTIGGAIDELGEVDALGGPEAQGPIEAAVLDLLEERESSPVLEKVA